MRRVYRIKVTFEGKYSKRWTVRDVSAVVSLRPTGEESASHDKHQGMGNVRCSLRTGVMALAWPRRPAGAAPPGPPGSQYGTRAPERKGRDVRAPRVKAELGRRSAERAGPRVSKIPRPDLGRR